MPPQNKHTSNLFLSRTDLENVRKWQYKVSDGSLTTLLLSPFWSWLAAFIPTSIAPNVITLAGFTCQLLAFWVSDPSIVPWIGSKVSAVAAAAFTYSYMTLDALDGKHARNTKQSSALGEIFDHACDNIGGAFSAIAFMRILASFEGIESFAHPAVMWYGVQAYGIAFLMCHLFAFDHAERKIVFKSLNGPGEMLHLMMWLMILRAFLPDAFSIAFSHLSQLSSVYDFIPWVEKHMQLSAVDFVYNSVRVLFLIVLAFALISVLLMRSEHSVSKFILLSVFIIRMVPSIIISMKFGTVAHSEGPSIVQIIGDGLFLATLTSDLIIAKIANRQVHVLLPVIALASIISHHVSIVAAFTYHITILFDLCTYLQRPLLSPARRIYCDGVFDLLHVGHMAQFRKALEVTDGDYLLVGVMNDRDCSKYKRKPVMSEDERYAAVAACAYVNEVVKNAPEAVTEEVLKENQIDFVAAGEEYEDVAALKASGKYDYYAVPRAKGILKFTTRTPGISTSELIHRIRSRDDLGAPATAATAAAAAPAPEGASVRRTSKKALSTS